MEDSETEQFSHLLAACNLTQHVNFKTHFRGNTIDYVITREDDNIVSSVTPGDTIADHSTVLVNLNIAKPSTIRQKISFRNLKAIDTTQFKTDLSNGLSNIDLPDDTSGALDVSTWFCRMF